MEEELSFGPFTFLPARRALLRDGKAVPVGSRAMDILLYLVSNAGELRTNADIVNHVWPDTFVEEANLRVHISALRKALGDTKQTPGFIANIPGRGYTFIATVQHGTKSPYTDNRNSSHADNIITPTSDILPTRFPVVMPRPLSRVFGRDQLIESLTEQLSISRLLTIVGPGGIGKSIVARAVVANGIAPEHTIWIDLSAVELGNLVPTVVASAIGIQPHSNDIIGEIAANLHSGKAVLVLDCCEHLIESAASFAEELLDRAPVLRILATSREPLRAYGERVHRIPALDLPEVKDTAAARQSPAVQLFIERADGFLGGFTPDDADLAHIVEICARLDGIPLAIELAAGRLETIGLESLEKSLADSFRILTRGRRTALPRHQTLTATLDWSYMILSAAEQRALRELSVFRGPFTIDSASAILSNGDAHDILPSLVAKSLIVADAAPDETRYRLLDTTRLYALQKLEDEGEKTPVMQKFICHLCDIYDGKSYELSATARARQEYQDFQQVTSLRVALQWAFGDDGDPVLGARLTVVALPLFFRLSLLDECLSHVTQALAYLDAKPGRDERSRMQLYAALGWPQLRAINAPEHGIAAWSTALAIAEDLGDLDYQLRAIWALWVDAINRAEPRLGLELAEKFQKLAQTSPDIADRVIGERLHGATLHWLGQHKDAQGILTKMLADYEALSAGQHSIRFQFDQRVTAIVILARISWVLGDTDGALGKISETLEYLTDISHDISLCTLLAEAGCPIAILSGKHDLAATYIAQLRDHTKALSLDVWHCYADCFDAELHLINGRPSDCLHLMQSCLATLQHGGFVLFQSYFQSVMAQAQEALGDYDAAIKTIDAAIAGCAQSGEKWCLAELHRVRGAILIRHNTQNSLEQGRTSLTLALELAHQDGAIGWENRIRRDMAAFALCQTA
ncbi:winged helix-turn-helix domain-containing protein [Thalassospira australica]|uniref:winged helix-turn-helix domain-containing protein n=1 Tax=Thalassospira australica TaxID=1528106 RepID=UPI00384F6264